MTRTKSIVSAWEVETRQHENISNAAVGIRAVEYRPTLGDALGPYRKFSNQILTSPLNGYATVCFKACDAFQLAKQNSSSNSLDVLANYATFLNLLLPLGAEWPTEVIMRLQDAEKKTGTGFVKDIIKRSISFIESK
jgi:hypothetical protein